MEGKGKTQAVWSLILGIASIIVSFFTLGFILGIVFGIIALVLANKAKQNGYLSGVRTAGKVLGIIGLVIAGICFFGMIFLAGAAASESYYRSNPLELW